MRIRMLQVLRNRLRNHGWKREEDEWKIFPPLVCVCVTSFPDIHIRGGGLFHTHLHCPKSIL